MGGVWCLMLLSLFLSFVVTVFGFRALTNWGGCADWHWEFVVFFLAVFVFGLFEGFVECCERSLASSGVDIYPTPGFFSFSPG